MRKATMTINPVTTMMPDTIQNLTSKGALSTPFEKSISLSKLIVATPIVTDSSERILISS